MRRIEVTAAYDSRAGEYIEQLGTLEQMAAQDLHTISSWRDAVAGRVLDAGCGPGHWSDLLAAGRRCDVVGVDASSRFVGSARQRFPHVPFLVADIGALPIAASSVDGMLAWFSIIHTPPGGLPALLREFARVLVPGGSLLLGFFDGAAGAPFAHAVATAYYWSPDSPGEQLADVGFAVDRVATRQDEGVRRQGEIVATLVD